MLELRNITKNYYVGEEIVEALKGVDIKFRESEFVSILGPSGCGKTTLLNIIGGLDHYTDGDLIINGKSTKEYRDKEWDVYRNHSIGFVFQSYNLIPHQTVLENVELALTLSGVSKKERKERAKEALVKVGLGDKLKSRPNQLSGGQMQRVAIARALVNDPDILLADEPTGALDSTTSVQIMDLLAEIAKDRLIIMVTHNPSLAEEYSTRIIKILDGKITSDSMPISDEVSEPVKTEEVAQDVLVENEVKTENIYARKDLKKKNKTSMSFFTALSLSFKNLMTKKGRTFLTSFAGSIGIIGIALILSISSGFQAYIDRVQKDTLSGYPITISAQTADISNMLSSMMNKDSAEEFPDDEVITASGTMSSMFEMMNSAVVSNDLKSFKAYLDNPDTAMDSNRITSIKYVYDIDYDVYSVKTVDGVNTYNQLKPLSFGMGSDMGAMESYLGSTFGEMIDNEEFIHSQYDLLKGSWNNMSSPNEAVLVIDTYNKISDYELYHLGIKNKDTYNLLYQMTKMGLTGKTLEELKMLFSYQYQGDLEVLAEINQLTNLEDLYKLVVKKNYSFTDEDIARVGVKFDDLIGTTYQIMPLSENYKIAKNGENKDYLVEKSDAEKDYSKSISLKIVGIVRRNKDVTSGSLSSTVSYSKALTNALIEYSNDSDNAVTKLQLDNSTTDVLDEDLPTITNTEYKENLKLLGFADYDNPESISIYPVSFEDKDYIEDYINAYNNQAEEGQKITYTDYLGIMMSSISTIIDAISYVLIGFVSVSLVVSSIMIGIITYISVLERIKEIGILRAVGASKKDISRVFTAETLIIGFVSGIIGIGITLLLTIPINLILKLLAGIANVAALPVAGAFILVFISMFLTFIAGLVPSRIAAKKDPVEALRSE